MFHAPAKLGLIEFHLLFDSELLALRRKKPPIQASLEPVVWTFARLISVMLSVADEVLPTQRRPMSLRSSHQALLDGMAAQNPPGEPGAGASHVAHPRP